MVGTFEEMVESDLVEGSCRGKRSDVAADAMLFFIGLANHAQGIPADQTGNGAFEIDIAGIERLETGRDSVDVGRVPRAEIRRAAGQSEITQLLDQEASTIKSARLQHTPEGINPFFRLHGIAVHLRTKGERSVERGTAITPQALRNDLRTSDHFDFSRILFEDVGCHAHSLLSPTDPVTVSSCRGRIN